MKNSNKIAKKPLGSKKSDADDDRGKDQYLIVVSILEGRNFQRRNGYNLIIEARLDGELMSTDEVEHTEHPYINTELAWEVKRDSLRIFRMQRVPIKLQCFAVDTKHGTKENIGFILLDLRLLHPKPRALKWYPLLHNKYHGMKCELNIGFYLEKDLGMPKQEPTVSSPIKQKNLLPINNEELVFEQPILNEDEGYYQLGPPDICKEIFSLSLTIVFADNLMELIPSTVHLPKEHDGFYFFYVFFGNDVTTDTFPDLISPSFAAERATVRIRSSFKILRRFLSSHPNLQVHLCVGDISLGCADIPLNKLLKNDMKSLTTPATIEKTFQLKPLRGDVVTSSKNSPAIVGISLSLKSIEKISERNEVIEEPEVLNENKSPSSSLSSESLSKQQIDSLSPYSSSPPVRLKTSENRREIKTYSSFENLSDVGVKSTQDKIVSNRNTDSDLKKSSTTSSSPRLQAGRDSQQEDALVVEDRLLNNDFASSTLDVTFHHYCFIVDIRHLRLQSVNNSVFCFLRYSYPFFGTSASIFTYPPVEIRGNSQVTLPHGFCAFTFAAGHDQLTMALQNLPLQIEVVQRDKQKSEDIVIGRSSINLALTLKVNKSRITTEDKKVGYRQTTAIETNVVNSEGLKIGELYVVMSLDDFGIINLDPESRKFQDHHTQNPILSTIDQSNVKPAALPSQNVPPRREEGMTKPSAWSFEDKPYSELHKQMAVQVAKELQQWKGIQQDYFNKQLAEKEAQYLESLATEWRKRETERELLYQRRITECEDMQDKLQRALFDIDKRERILSNREQELLQAKAEFDQKCERQEKEIKLGYIRMQEDFNHRLHLEREKNQEVENQKTRLELQVGELEKKLEAKIHEFEIYREEQRNNPEMRLQSELHLLALEKAELERKLEAAVKSKVHYKQQWGRCLRELARIKQKLEADARAQLYKQQQELENMRLQYLASEGKEENSVLQEIKGDLNIIKENVSKSKLENEETSVGKNRHISFLDSDIESDNESDKINIERLKKEREALLKTGVYTQEDRIIRELDRQIKEAVLRKLT